MSSAVCSSNNPESQNFDVIVVVKSGVSNFENRRRLREAYGSFVNENAGFYEGVRIGLVFVMGRPRTQEDNLFQRGPFTLELTSGGGRFLNPESLQEARSLLEAEMLEYNDLVIGDFEDTYFNLTQKMMYSFTWASTFCRQSQPNIMFIDDDYTFNHKFLVRTIKSLNPVERAHLLHGKLVFNGKVFRLKEGSMHRWGVLKEEIPWPIYPTYAYGIYLLAGFQQVERLTLGMYFTQQFHIDDVWLGIVAAKMGIKLKSITDIGPSRGLLKSRRFLTPLNLR